MGFNILCCFYSEFHTEKGAEILFQYPQNFIKEEEFMMVSEFVIPQTELCENFLSIKLGETYLLGFPIFLKNSKYERAKFQFNFCFLISQEEYERNNLIYEFLLKKIGRTFESFERDSDFDFIKKNRDLIHFFLEKLYNSMITKEDVIFIDLEEKAFAFDSLERKKFFFHFKYLDFSKAKTQVLPYLVPVWVKSIDKEDLKGFETLLKLVIENIDGLSFVKKIASRSELDLNYVIYVLYNLLLMDCIALVDVFQFSNIYRANINMRSFLNASNNSNSSLKEEFRNFCYLNLCFAKNFKAHKAIFDIYNPLVGVCAQDEKCVDFYLDSIDDAKFFSFYCELSVAKDVNLFIKNTMNFGIFISLFIAFGVYKKIIRRVNVYVLERNKEIKDLKENKEYNNNDQKRLFLGLLDGKHCLDEVCCETNKSLKEVEAIIKQIDGIIIIYK